MRAHQIMTTEVHTVRPHTSIAEIARLMTDKRISGVPVVEDDGHLVGIVSQTDLLHRAETGTERKRKWWIALFIDSDMRARDFVKAHGLKAEDVMGRYVISVSDNAKLSEVADILDANNLKRVPVLKDGKLVGIITRGDLVRALASANFDASIPEGNNAAVQKALLERIQAQSWVNTSHLNVVVHDNVIELWGFAETEDRRKALLVLVREAAGTRRIDDHIIIGPRRVRSAA